MNEITKAPDLQPCPSCGGTPEPGCVSYGTHFIDSMAFNVECCECHLRTVWCRKPQEAVDIWNSIKGVMFMATYTRDARVGRDMIKDAEYFDYNEISPLFRQSDKPRRVYYAIMRTYWKLSGKIERAYWAVRYGLQRMFKGYDYRDLIEMDSRFVRRYTKILTEYRKNHHGCPATMTNEEWNGIIDELLYHLHYMNDDNVDDELTKDAPDGWVPTVGTTNEITNKHKDEFFALFSKYFFYLWD